MQVGTTTGADQPRLLGVETVARDFGCSAAAIYRHVADDDFPIPHVRVGRLIKFRKADVEAFVSRNGGA